MGVSESKTIRVGKKEYFLGRVIGAGAFSRVRVLVVFFLLSLPFLLFLIPLFLKLHIFLKKIQIQKSNKK